ncbi:hypothetical protein [Kitasatospora sp. SUK 42]|uniref:hypothetical protein n=1 Tax=Kitasatospora sp. SUK 42 TaxID=1588882 RepID=UPI0018CAEEA8|nr:hypothetical protein [Kitasatospora sp. SUK 42]MBV2153143.1 hypothetical protein [Kitasatospora sp. SUK 42]
MVDVAHIIPRSPDDPPPPPPWWRRRWLAGVLAVAVVVGGGLWVWKPWWSLEIPQSACWSVLSKDDLTPLAGEYGEVFDIVPRARMLTPMSPEEALIRSTSCRIGWRGDDGDRGWLLSVDVTAAWDGIDADRAQDASRGQRVAALDFGPGSVGLATTGEDHRVRLYVRCDFQVPTGDDPKRKAPQYFRVDVGSDELYASSPAKGRQAYGDIALKIARVAVAEYQCGNQVQLPVSAPVVPDLPKEKADG